MSLLSTWHHNADDCTIVFTNGSIKWVPEATYQKVKQPEREVNHSPPSNDEVKNEWSYTFVPLYAFMAWTTKNLRFIYTHTYIYTYIHTYIYLYIHTNIHTCIPTKYIHIYIRTYIHTFTHSNVYTYIYAYIHTYIHTYIHE
jgi:hypothetical protein